MKIRRLALLGAMAVTVLSLAACGGDGGGGGDGDGGNGGTTDTAPPAPAGDTVTITAPSGASNSGFAETQVAAPADAPFTILFVNDDDGIPHNVQVFEGTDTTGTPAWAPEGNAVVTGPDEIDYEVPSLAAGEYAFNCVSHPTTMVGTLTVA